MFIRKIICAMTIVFWALMCSGVPATQYYVSPPPDGNDSNTGLSWAQAFATVGKGIDVADDGDVIDVNVGTYSAAVDFDGKAITIRSTDPNDWEVVDDTVITSTVVLFTSGEEANSVLLGCKVDGEVFCSGSSPTIRKCIITGGISCNSSSSATIENNKITRSSGNGVAIGGSAGVIRNNWIYDSTDGILFANAPAVDVNNNTIVGNSSAGIRVVAGTAPDITNCILWGNNGDLVGCTATYSCIEDGDGGTGNISSDPCFVDAANDNFHLKYASDCIDAGDPNGQYYGSTDIDGDLRVQADIGADETGDGEFLPPFGCKNEPNVVESIDFGAANDDDPNYTGGIIWTSTGISDPCTDPIDGNILYRELKANNKAVVIDFPAFNLDDGYDLNDPNDPNSLPLTDMLLEIMYKDTVNDTDGNGLVVAKSEIDFINLDPDYLGDPKYRAPDDRRYYMPHLRGLEDGRWKYVQYVFQKNDFQLLRAIDGYFTITIVNSNDNNIPINYVSLRKITSDEYEAFIDKQRAVKGFYEVELPTDAPDNPSYDDPDMVIFSRDIMRPVYQHTKPAEDEPNSITGFGVRSQVEPLSFSIYSEGGTNELAISVSDLAHSDGNTISSDDITISRVIYKETRLGYHTSKNYALLPEWLDVLGEAETFSVDANMSERIWLKIDMRDYNDANLPSGLYEGSITIDPDGEDPNTTVPIDFTVYDINLLLPEHVNPVNNDPFMYVYSNDLNEVFDAYYETGFDASIGTLTHRIMVSGDANNLVFDSNNFEAALKRMVDEGHAVDTVIMKPHGWIGVYNCVMDPDYTRDDPELYYNLSDSSFADGVEELLGVYEDIADSYDPNLDFIYKVSDEPGKNHYKRILCDRLYTIIKDCNDPCGLQTGESYHTSCDETVYYDPDDYYNVPDGKIGPLTDLVDYKIWGTSNVGAAYTKHKDPGYHGDFGYYTTGQSHYYSPVYNRFLHGLFAFRTDATVVGAHAMGHWSSVWDIILTDPYNDFDPTYERTSQYIFPDFLFAYPTWSGELLYTIGGLEGLREGIKDAAYIATLKDLIDDDPDAPVAIEAQDYLDEIKSRISTDYKTAYADEMTELGYYQEILEDVSEDSDPNDFEAFTEIRRNITDYIVLLDSGIDYKVHNLDQDTWYTTIQGAINKANNDDTLLAYPDTYSEAVDFNGVACTLTSTDPNDWKVVDSTVITSTVVLFTSGEEANSVLLGCKVDSQVYCSGSSPTIQKCIITEGISCSSSSATIENNKISNSSGSGVVIGGSAGAINNNWIYECSTNGILFANATAVVDVNNNTIVGNTSAGIRVVYGTAPNVTNCILWDNDDDLVGCTATYSCIEDGDGVPANNNISSDPCFVDDANDDFHLDVNSLCINAGDPNGDYTGQVDIDGDQRVIRDRVDMGADEAKRVYNIDQELWYLDIQPAIDDANTNDVIVVYGDTYTGEDNRDLDFGGKAITVRGSDPDDWDVVEATVIDCDASQFDRHRGFYFHNNESTSSVVSGLTITRGYGDIRYGYLPGRAIFCDGSSPTITNCLITDNSANYGLDSDGGGIACYNGASPEISNCIISDNYAKYAGGISCWDSEPTIRNCLIAGNSAGLGGGIACYEGEGSLHPEIVNCTFSDNSASYGGGMHNEDSEPNVVNCIFWDDSAVSGNDEIYNYSADPNFSYCDIEGCGGSDNWDPSFGTDCGGNIDSDPLFVADDDYYHIDVNSPCIDAGDPNGNYDDGQVDIDFEDRVVGDNVDMGADECDS